MRINKNVGVAFAALLIIILLQSITLFRAKDLASKCIDLADRQETLLRKIIDQAQEANVD